MGTYVSCILILTYVTSILDFVLAYRFNIFNVHCFIDLCCNDTRFLKNFPLSIIFNFYPKIISLENALMLLGYLLTMHLYSISSIFFKFSFKHVFLGTFVETMFSGSALCISENCFNLRCIDTRFLQKVWNVT